MSAFTTRATATTFTAPSTNVDVLGEALGRIITGRPLPESLRPAAIGVPSPATAQEGIAWILAGPSGRRPGDA